MKVPGCMWSAGNWCRTDRPLSRAGQHRQLPFSGRLQPWPLTTKDAHHESAHPQPALPHRPHLLGPRLQPRRLGRLRQNRARQLHQGQWPEKRQTGRHTRAIRRPRRLHRRVAARSIPAKTHERPAGHRAVPVQQKIENRLRHRVGLDSSDRQSAVSGA